MSINMEKTPTSSISSLPTDIQINILSFLLPIDIISIASTCRHFATLCHHSSPSLWPALCHRRWSSKTHLSLWSSSPSPILYRTLHRWEHLIGFWRRIDGNIPSLLLFHWTSSSITASRISPSPANPTYDVRKTPFLWLGLSASGDALCYLLGPDVVPATLSFMGCNHLAVEERRNSLEAGSPPDRAVSEMYQYFANRAGPGRQRRKKERERIGRKRWEADHFVKIQNCFPTPERPLQGLWKVIDCHALLFFVDV